MSFILGKCQCNCNENIRISSSGYLRKYKQGHQNKFRIKTKHHNWKGGGTIVLKNIFGENNNE